MQAQVRHLNMVYEMPAYATRQAWQQRAAWLKEHILLSCGLLEGIGSWKWTGEAKRAVAFETEDYRIERIAVESLPRYHVTGSLFVPKSGKPPYPAMLHPHGHFEVGRLNDADIIRAIALAKAGCLVVAYDMIGYNDHFQLAHNGPEGVREYLWGFSRAGLQLRNSIRILDFVCSLPLVDKRRIGCSGISGGGTQTFMLAAIDERVKIANPVKMVSCHMQGGCICENPPNLRVDAINPEIAALTAPRPQLLISDAQDWTDDTPAKGYPFIRSIYRLMNAEERVQNVHLNEGHQFGTPAREAYYRWVHHQFKLKTMPVDPPGLSVSALLPALRVWGDSLPKPVGVPEGDAVFRLFQSHVQQHLERLHAPRNRQEVQTFQKRMRPILQHALNLEPLPLPSKTVAGTTLLIVGSSEAELAPYQSEAKKRGWHVSTLMLAGKPDEAIPAELHYYATYNPTPVASRTGQVVQSLTDLARQYKTVHIAGLGEAGLETLLARAVWQGQGATLVDTARFDPGSNDAFAHRLYSPCLRFAGDLVTACALIAPHPLSLFSLHPNFSSEHGQRFYRLMGVSGAFQTSEKGLTSEAFVHWLGTSK
jgi:hypothetical protein